MCPQQFHTSKFTVFFLLIFSGTVYSAPQIPYSHCNNVVPEPLKYPDSDPNAQLPRARLLTLRNAYCDYTEKSAQEGNFLNPQRSLFLRTRKVYRTQTDGVFKIDSFLRLTGARGRGYFGNFTHRELRLVHYRPPRIPLTSRDAMNVLGFSMNGYWDSSSGKVCMVGSGLGKLRSVHAVLKLDYPDSSSIYNSLVNGTLERLDVNNDYLNLKHVKILGVNLRSYKYELIDKEVKNKGFPFFDDLANASLGVEDLEQTVCQFIRSAGVVELNYMSDCSSVHCDFLGGGNSNSTPRVMNFNEIECSEDGRVRYLLSFGDLVYNGYQLPFEPNMTLVSEGKWNAEKKRLDMVGCRILSDSGRSWVGECMIRLSLRFPARWTLRERSAVVGEMWSSRSVNESNYLGRMALTNRKNKNIMVKRLKYEFTESENVTRWCTNRMQKVKGGTYPSGQSSDMRFDMLVRNKNIKEAWGYASPLYVDDRFYRASAVLGREVEPREDHVRQNHRSVINVSYVLSFAAPLEFKLSNEFMQVKSVEISAEGLYDSKSGHLCMVGCMQESPSLIVGMNSSLDCEILVEIQYPSLNAKKGGLVKGTIKSTRVKFDPFYFEPFHILSRSIYTKQAKETIWRMDLEITMVLISNTLTCIFVGLQLFHVKRHPNVLPFISVMMLFVLSLAHLIPLLLNFEALFMLSHKSGNNLNIYFGSDGWLELNEVLVRVITMIAFLLELRLLQLAWLSKSSDESQTALWISDKKVLYLSLPMYIGGGLIAWFVHLLRKSYPRSSLRVSHVGYKQLSLWGDLKLYAGLILDGLLFPQILFNLFCDAKEKALAPSFYFGTTLVRLLPHAYDLYRSRSSTWSFNYIYANPRMDYYSTTWDIVICLGGLLFVFLIYLQQRFGGCCFLPKRYRNSTAYEKVPVVTNESF
ncbi:uncharacterized protein LOC111370578 [Olea europaea subsp. europaea]|uniref:RING-type E3 ubiquitin transferase n=1 Tax=Olea europaea subsp. europaea TaxID=158383 RepID=A0A8S0U7T8_OLEEU|nr:uncharacterized protein LOC111370578 [Olea europaea subsp. europaea]